MSLSLPLIDNSNATRTPARTSPFPVAERKSHFLKQFAGPGEDSEIVCFRFWELVHASGCPFRCAYCFLQTVAYFRVNKAALMGQVYRNVDDLLDEVREWLTAPTPRMLIVGELQDGLAFDSAYASVTGKPFTHHIIPLFAAQQRHRLIFLTKSTLIKHALQMEPTPQVIFSWSVNAEYVSKKWEIGAPSPSGRFNVAKTMKEAGWPIRFRLDPMVPYQDGDQDWRPGYAEAIDRINALAPEMVTIGALRATSKTALQNAAEKNERPSDIFNYLSEKDPSNFKHRLPFEQQVELFRFALERLDQQRIVPALCKEDASVWAAVGLKFNGCHCLMAGTTVPGELVSSTSYINLVQNAGKTDNVPDRDEQTPSTSC
jgi:spore photoproduct lyase